MRRSWLLFGCCVAAIGCTQAPDGYAPTKAAANDLVVHEWGTFTSMVDAEGRLLGGMHHDDAPLPDFVIRNPMRFALAADGKMPEPTQRMETPVLYLHTARKQVVQVRVAFPFGLMSEWFPEGDALLPAGTHTDRIEGGMLRWLVEVDPAIDFALAPPVADDSIWAPSRRVAVAPLRPVALRAPAPAGSDQVERLLFYRGVGQFELPVSVKASDDAVVVHNHADRTVAAALLLRVDGDHAGLVVLGAVPATQARTIALPAADRPIAAVVTEARAALLDALEAAGLFGDEARAMVDTWGQSYFHTPGVRLLYLLPQPWTEALLPLQVQPKPAATVRALVARVEVLRPADQGAIVAQLDAMDADLATLADPKLRLQRELALVHALAPYAESRLLWACAKRVGAARVGCEAALEWAHRGW